MADNQRRHFLASAGALASLSVLSASSHATPSQAISLPPVLHMVYFWLKNPDSQQDREKLITGLNSLREIPQIKALHVGVPASTLVRDVIDNSFDVSELMLFDSVEDQDAYQLHPLHQKFVEECSHLWRKVIVRDSISA
ncbi:Dabb family protein [Alteromonas sp. D210916BOD_24]|uniref:Dabb family protein n=1 Tax=Alteromonas sp. D210916BOD_24 TaxID=3157618 RepID=UPI00399CEBEC